jgi:small-conductance mechanosensitive channel
MEENHEFGSGLRAHLGFEFAEPLALETPPPPEPVPEQDPREEELAQRLSSLAAAEDALAERARQVAEREDRASRRESDLDEHEQALQTAVDVRRLLRQRAEQHADGVWRSFKDAMHATLHDGSPDHAMRIAAARALLAEAYTEAGGAALEDELAQLRARRSANA